jgi:cullin 3
MLSLRQRNTLTHQALLTEVIGQLSARFRPEVAMIKTRIELLIDREYLERMENTERPTYRYLA